VVKKGDRKLIEVEAEENPYTFLKGRREDSDASFDRVEGIADAAIAKEAKRVAGH